MKKPKRLNRGFLTGVIFLSCLSSISGPTWSLNRPRTGEVPVATDIVTVGTDIVTVATDIVTVGTDRVTVATDIVTVGTGTVTVATDRVYLVVSRYPWKHLKIGFAICFG
jgi:hypothetical protein